MILEKLQAEPSKQLAFTVIELLVVISIMALIAAISIPSFRNWRERQDLTAAQRELATNLQKARSHALAGRRMSNNLISRHYLVRLSLATPTVYTIEGIAYDSGGGADKIFNGTAGAVLERWALPGDIAIRTIQYERPAGTPQADPSCALIGFSLPFGNTYADTDTADGLDDDGVCDFYGKYQDNTWLLGWSNAKVVITLAKPGSSLTRTVTVNGVTGQITGN